MEKTQALKKIVREVAVRTQFTSGALATGFADNQQVQVEIIYQDGDERDIRIGWEDKFLIICVDKRRKIKDLNGPIVYYSFGKESPRQLINQALEKILNVLDWQIQYL